MEEKKVPIGIRISEKVKNRFDVYCNTHGIKKSFLLGSILEEKLGELEEEEEDLRIALNRLEDETISLDELNKYFRKRGIK